MKADHELSGLLLEEKVRNIFSAMGFKVKQGPKSGYDAKVEGPPGFDPCVVEVKSSTKRMGPRRKDLRQLDDWVYELSDEELARKHGLGGKADAWSIGTSGYFLKPSHHPTPHKGVMVFNGPLHTPFGERKGDLLPGDLREFADKRNFCVIRFEVLLDWHRAISRNRSLAEVFWQEIHDCAGELTGPGEASAREAEGG